MLTTDSIWRISLSFGVGIFFGLAPIWGVQMLTALAAAYIFRLNKIIVLLASNVSLPPLIPLWIYLSLQTGALIMGDYHGLLSFDKSLSLESIKANMIQYIIGSVSIAVILGVLSGLLIATILFFIRRVKTVKEAVEPKINL